MLPANCVKAVEQCKALYGDGLNCLTVFSPDVQESTLRAENLERVFMGSAPTLSTLALAYGRETAESWVIAQLNDLNEWACTKERLTAFQIDRVARLIVAAYPYLKLTELAYFFAQFKAGEYGRFYGTVDSISITTALRQKFLPKRESIRTRLYEQRTEREKLAEEKRKTEEMKRFYEQQQKQKEKQDA